MRMNGAGIGMIMATTVKVLETTQPVPRRARAAASAGPAVVVGSSIRTTATFFSVSATTRTSPTTILASVWCVPVLLTKKIHPVFF